MNWEEITKSIDCAEQCEHKFAWDDAACITIVIGNLDKWEGSQLDVLADCQHALMLLSPNANNLSMKMFFKNICIISSTIVEELRPNETFFLRFISFWLHWVFLAVCGLSLVAALQLQCMDFLPWLLLLQSMGFNRCSTWVQ